MEEFKIKISESKSMVVAWESVVISSSIFAFLILCQMHIFLPTSS